MAKIELVTVLTQDNAFSFWGFVLETTETALVLLKNGIRDFQNSPPFERLTSFYVTITRNFESLQYFNTKPFHKTAF